jgi:hypothetical protein
MATNFRVPFEAFGTRNAKTFRILAQPGSNRELSLCPDYWRQKQKASDKKEKEKSYRGFRQLANKEGCTF